MKTSVPNHPSHRSPGTPLGINKVYTSVAEALKPQDVRERLTSLGIEAIVSTPQELAKHLKAELDDFGKVIKEAGIKVE